jgi:potassium voltage-gated channel Eag-related subfamily H protein
MFQLIFRKVADVRREKELAERRKNEPQLDQNQDHLVRKIFSKFRRDRSVLTPQNSQSPSQDPEKGEQNKTEGTTPGTLSKAPSMDGAAGASLTKLSSVAEKEEVGGGVAAVVTGTAVVVARPTTVRASKWGRLLGSSIESDSTSTASVSRTHSVRDSPGKSSGSGGNGGGSGNKVFPKLQKVTATSSGLAPATVTRQEIVEEEAEKVEEPARPPSSSRPNNLRKLDSYDSGIKSELKVETPFRPQPPGTPAEFKEIMTNIMDFKVDVKLEVQKLNQKVARMEELLTEVLSRLGSASPSSASASGTEVSGNKSGSVEGRSQAGEVGALVLRKRRSKSRTKGAAPSVPPRASPTSESQRTSDPEQPSLHLESPSSSQPPSTSLSAPPRIEEEALKRPYPRRPREFL